MPKAGNYTIEGGFCDDTDHMELTEEGEWFRIDNQGDRSSMGELSDMCHLIVSQGYWTLIEEGL